MLFSNFATEPYNQFTLEGSLTEVEESSEQIRTSKSLGNIPLIVVTGGGCSLFIQWSLWLLG